LDKLIPLIKLCKVQEFKSNSKSVHKKSYSISNTLAPFQQRKSIIKRISVKPTQVKSNLVGQYDVNHSIENPHRNIHHMRTSSEKVKPSIIDQGKKVSKNTEEKKKIYKASRHISALITPSSSLIKKITKKDSAVMKKKANNSKERAPSVDIQKRSSSFASTKRGIQKATLSRPNSSASKRKIPHRLKMYQRISAQALFNPFGKFISKENKRKGSAQQKIIHPLNTKEVKYSIDHEKSKVKVVKALPETPDISIPQSKDQSVANSPKNKKPNTNNFLPLSSENLNKLKFQKEVEKLINYIHNYFKEHNEGPPTTTEFYRIGRLLGKGAFGKVNLGMHKLTGKMVAIKSINKDCFTDEESKKKVMQEFSILKLLKHQSVIRLYESFESKKHVLFIVELCAGGDLLNYVRRRRRLKEPIAQLILRQLINGLEYCHYKGIIHRDIKLDNVLLNAKGNIKIGDFGVSKCIRKGEKMYEQCGTPAYIAPEILRDKGYEGFSADIWSAGVALYAILYGTIPFKCNDIKNLQKRILKGKYNLKNDVSQEVRDLLRRMLEVDPRKRITESEILAHPWMQQHLDKGLSLFTEAEKIAIKREYLYMRKTNNGTATLFTEQNIDSTQNELTRNVTTKSAILAPFNTSQSDCSSSKNAPLFDKQEIIKFSDKARDPDRQYEKCNNADLDQNAPKAFLDNTKNASLSDNSNSIEDSFDESDVSNYSEAFGEEPKQTESTQPQSAFKYSIDKDQKEALDEGVIKKVEAFGYSRQYITDCLIKGKMNYTTAAYYLLLNNS